MSSIDVQARISAVVRPYLDYFDRAAYELVNPRTTPPRHRKMSAGDLASSLRALAMASSFASAGFKTLEMRLGGHAQFSWEPVVRARMHDYWASEEMDYLRANPNVYTPFHAGPECVLISSYVRARMSRDDLMKELQGIIDRRRNYRPRTYRKTTPRGVTNAA